MCSLKNLAIVGENEFLKIIGVVPCSGTTINKKEKQRRQLYLEAFFSEFISDRSLIFNLNGNVQLSEF